MLLFIYFLMGLSTYCIVDGKYVNLKMDSEDLLKIIKQLINSGILKKFAKHVYSRNVGLTNTYNNPYHPEDELTSFFDETFFKNVYPKKTQHTKKKKNVTNIFGKENEVFANVHESEDLIIDNADVRSVKVDVGPNKSVSTIDPIVQLMMNRTKIIPAVYSTTQNDKNSKLENNIVKSNKSPKKQIYYEKAKQ